MERINILFLFSAKGFGGIAKNISLIVSNLDPQSFKSTIILLANPDDGEVSQEFEKCSEGSPGNFEFLRMGEGKKFDLSVLRAIRDKIREDNIQILSCHGYKADVLGFILRTFLGVKLPLVSIAHGWSTRSRKILLYTVLDRICLSFFNRLILVSEGQKKWLRNFFINPKRISVIHNAVESDHYRKTLESRLANGNGHITSRLGNFDIDSSRTVVGYAGRLSGEKDVATCIRAISIASKQRDDILFLVVGEGERRLHLEQLAAELGISERIVFAGYQSDMLRIYPLFDIYVSSSLREGLPNSVLEAMASGIPCVLTNVPGHTEIIENGVNGFLVDVEDAQGLAQRIVELAADKVLVKGLTQCAYETIEEKFSIETRIYKLSQVYRELLNV